MVLDIATLLTTGSSRGGTENNGKVTGNPIGEKS
jgi:hypothetical protein